MWRHNYDGFKERMSRGQQLSQNGDRDSYTESLGAMEAQYKRDESAKKAEKIILGVFAAPFIAYAAAELAPLAVEGISSLYGEASFIYNEAGRQLFRGSMYLLNEGKVGFGIVSAMISNGTFQLNSQQLYQAYQRTMTPSPYNNVPALMQALRNFGPLKGYFY
jgi:hypothetical protein